MTIDANKQVKQGRPASFPFHPDKVVDGHQQSKILQAHPECLTDILPRIYDNKEDRKILASWMRHFKKKSVPFVVTKLPSDNKKWPAVFTVWTIQYS